MAATQGIPPAITEETRPFWDGAACGRLVVERCAQCRLHVFPPRGICRRCRGRRMDTTVVDGPGTVYSFTTNFQPWLLGQEVPFSLVVVEFPGFPGFRVLGRLRGCAHDEVVIGMTVSVGFEPGPGGVAIPSFVAEPGMPG